METIINRFNNPARAGGRGGRSVLFRTFATTTTVLLPGGIRRVDTREYFKDVGTLMDPVRNHVPEQPANKYKQLLIARNRAAASRPIARS